MTPEQIADEIANKAVRVEYCQRSSTVRFGFGLNEYQLPLRSPDVAEGMASAIRIMVQDTIADAIRAAAVDDAIRADAAKTVRAMMSGMMERGAITLHVPSGIGGREIRVQPNAGALERLAFLLGLSPMERAFIHGAESGGAPATWLIFADWLDEHGRQEEADRFRTLFARPRVNEEAAILNDPLLANNVIVHMWMAHAERKGASMLRGLLEACRALAKQNEALLRMSEREFWARLDAASPYVANFGPPGDPAFRS